jgi:alanine racemase
VWLLPMYFIKEWYSFTNYGPELENTSFAAIIQYQLEPEIYCLKGLLLFKKKEKNLYHFYSYQTRYWNRLGFEDDSMDEL